MQHLWLIVVDSHARFQQCGIQCVYSQGERPVRRLSQRTALARAHRVERVDESSQNGSRRPVLAHQTGFKQRSLAKLSEIGQLWEVNRSHVIQVTAPDAVIEAVVEVLATAEGTQVPQAR